VKVLAVFTHGPGIIFNTKRPDHQGRRPDGPEVARGRRHGQRDQQGAGHERHAQAGARELRAAVHRRDGRHAVPGRVGRGFKIDKVIKHATQFPGGLYNTSFVFMMNQAKYDALPPDVKKAVDEISGEFAARMFGQGLGQGRPPRPGLHAGRRRAVHQGRRRPS
jgi:TRAP-type transport system periplasmic protein